jgi:hypothetical protein
MSIDRETNYIVYVLWSGQIPGLKSRDIASVVREYENMPWENFMENVNEDLLNYNTGVAYIGDDIVIIDRYDSKKIHMEILSTEFIGWRNNFTIVDEIDIEIDKKVSRLSNMISPKAPGFDEEPDYGFGTIMANYLHG